jgi:hypothetical protein
MFQKYMMCWHLAGWRYHLVLQLFPSAHCQWYAEVSFTRASIFLLSATQDKHLSNCKFFIH